jgi:cytochrome c
LRQTQIQEENVKLLSLLVAAAALVVSVGAAAAQDAAAGEKVFAKCKICHQIGEGAKNMVGPVLNGVVGRHSGIYEGYHYSDANKNSGLTWDEATLKEYLRDPKAKVPGTKMVFPGLKSDDDIANVIAYLKQFGPDGKKI